MVRPLLRGENLRNFGPSPSPGGENTDDTWLRMALDKAAIAALPAPPARDQAGGVTIGPLVCELQNWHTKQWAIYDGAIEANVDGMQSAPGRCSATLDSEDGESMRYALVLTPVGGDAQPVELAGTLSVRNVGAARRIIVGIKGTDWRRAIGEWASAVRVVLTAIDSTGKARGSVDKTFPIKWSGEAVEEE